MVFLLAEEARPYDIRVTSVEETHESFHPRFDAVSKTYEYRIWRGEVCSSSRIRAAVCAGDVALARDLLAHPFLVEGRVVRGDRRGRELGYPTANLTPCRRSLWPADGSAAHR